GSGDGLEEPVALVGVTRRTRRICGASSMTTMEASSLEYASHIQRARLQWHQNSISPNPKITTAHSSTVRTAPGGTLNSSKPTVLTSKMPMAYSTHHAGFLS